MAAQGAVTAAAAAEGPAWAPRRQPRSQGGVGVHAGCFVGAGYGLSVGFGAVSRRRGGAVVAPLPGRLFVHDGALAGAFCGVGAGAGFGGMLALGFGLPFPRIPLPTLQRPELPAFAIPADLPRPTDYLVRFVRTVIAAARECAEHPPNLGSPLNRARARQLLLRRPR